MKKNKLAALTVTGSLILGTLATAMPVMAEETATTTINLAVTDSASTYELSIPTALDVKNSGYNELSGGITIKNLKNATDVASISVTAASNNGWILKNAAGDGDEIGYKIVSADDIASAKEIYSFTDLSSMGTDTGQTIACGINVDDYSNAVEGSYSDTITWTASVVRSDSSDGSDDTTASLSDMFTDGAIIEVVITCEQKSQVYTIENDNGTAVIQRVVNDGTVMENVSESVKAYIDIGDLFKKLSIDVMDAYGYTLDVWVPEGDYFINTYNENVTLDCFKVNGIEYTLIEYES